MRRLSRTAIADVAIPKELLSRTSPRHVPRRGCAQLNRTKSTRNPALQIRLLFHVVVQVALRYHSIHCGI
jgi:hypothetical protein